jgi:aryl-alcohol dehydrogenase-like predicted oxidoreductase
MRVMRYVDVAGEHLSVIGVGAWQFGSREWSYGDEYANTTAIEIVHRALELGVNLLDTAEIYGFGNSERIVGRAIADRRDKAFVASKLLPVVPPIGPGFIEARARKSLQRLGIDALDLYQVHWPNPALPKRTLADGLRRLVETDLVRHVGVSNYSRSGWEALESELGSTILSNQVQYSLAVRKPDRELVPYAQEHDKLIIAYSPLAQGLLGAKYDAGNVPKDLRRNNPLFLPENLDRAQPLIERVRAVADAHDATPAQVALAWVISHANVVAIPGASSVEQLEANVAAADLELTADELASLTRASDAFTPPSGVTAYAKVAKRRALRQ